MKYRDNFSDGNTVVLVDLDFTLVNANTTFDFLKLFFYTKYAILSKLLVPITLLNRCAKTDVYKQLMVILCLKGKQMELLKSYSKVYYNLIKKRKDKYFNKTILSFLDTTNAKKVLLTASLDIIAEYFKELGFDAVMSSRTYDKNGKFVRIIDIYNKKHMIVNTLSRYFDNLVIIDEDPEPEYYNIRGVKVIKVQRT